MKLTFVEAIWFTQRLKRRLDDDGYRLFQNELESNPLRGTPIPGCGGLRKTRFADARRGKGKRGGLRVIYLYIPEVSRVDLIDIYGKDEKDDLSAREKQALAEFARAIRDEALRSFKRGSDE